MGQKSAQAPIIIKRVKKTAGGGHHGGAWKVAYADFVTAMMAFFLLMWLLNATTEDQRMALATYFTPTISVSQTSGGGDDVLMGSSIFTQDIMPQEGTGGGVDDPAITDGTLEARAVLEALIAENVSDAATAAEMIEHMGVRLSDEGLIIELFSQDGRPLFVAGESELTRLAGEILAIVASMGDVVTNNIAVQVLPTDEAVDSARWLTVERAQIVAEELGRTGLPLERIERVTGGSTPVSDPSEQKIRITFISSPRE
ncbi:flagellar motor protein MotB [Pontivivens insulae]|uniref:Motility protein B n=1 Tax=Pontivivens insulae TaxID=1639689 RepID=A0A2R8A9H9_9RHOB|nr:flagellar motor protein MotB [Pontivivens insulae]RED12793.1 chemotaxis protein MotB [Pontivivens insulae]SPF28884.1 Motility protein B [Pontivivens insulae]